MIFGFNTDIKQGDTVYHVQSEAREGELLLQTQVFVRGRCIGKRATPYGDKLADGFTDQQKEHGLRDQHRLVLDAIRDGHLDDILDKRETPETLAAVKELDVQWLNANSVHADRSLIMRLRVTESGSGPSPRRGPLVQAPSEQANRAAAKLRARIICVTSSQAGKRFAAGRDRARDRPGPRAGCGR